MDDVTGGKFNGMFLLANEGRSAFCNLGYSLCNGELDLTGKMPPNYIAALRRAYVEGEWGGNFAHFNLDAQGYPL